MTFTHRCAVRFSSLAIVVLLCAALFGCGSSTPKASGEAGSTGTSSVSSSPAGGPAAAATTKPVDVCGLLPVAEVAQITHQPLSQAETADDKLLTGNGIFKCKYTSADGRALVDVTVSTKIGRHAYDAEYDAAKQVNPAGVTDVPGVGDEAFGSFSGLTALYGNTEIRVTGLNLAFATPGGGNDALTPAITLVKTVHDRL